MFNQKLAENRDFLIVDRVGRDIEIKIGEGKYIHLRIDEFIQFADTVEVARNNLIEKKNIDPS